MTWLTSRAFYTNDDELSILKTNEDVSVPSRQRDRTNWNLKIHLFYYLEAAIKVQKYTLLHTQERYLKELSQVILSYFSQLQNYLKIEGKQKITI